MNIQEILNFFTPPKIIGVCFAIGTLGYVFYLTVSHKEDFWSAVKGDNNKLDIIEAVVIIWMVLFVAMITADFALGLHASSEAWYSMDAIFFFSVAGNKFAPRTKTPEPPKE